MLIARAPLRISFGGGGTDLEAYYGKYGGVVLSASINKYIYGIVTNNFDSNFQIISADYQSLFSAPSNGNSHKANGKNGSNSLGQDNTLRLPKAVLEHFGMEKPVNVFMASEVTPGTGLGSSGATAVNLITIFSALTEKAMSKGEIAETAYHVEVNKLGAPVGKQDQYGSAFGGINFIKFEKDGVTVEPVRLDWPVMQALERRLMLFFTGNSRQAWKILEQQQKSTAQNEGRVISSLDNIKALAFDMKSALETGDLDRFGHLLDESWKHKKQISSDISSSAIDEAYQIALSEGATGGKITGAGGGGFLLVYCEEQYQERVRTALEELKFSEMHFAFEFQGARVLVNTGSLLRELQWARQ